LLSFAPASGLLAVNDPAGAAAAQVSVSETGYVQVALGGVMHTSDPAAAAYDTALAGACAGTLHTLDFQASDAAGLVLDGLGVPGSLSIVSDQAVSVIGAVHAGGMLSVSAPSLDVPAGGSLNAATVQLSANVLTLEGTISADGPVGGSVAIQAGAMIQAGVVTADGSAGAGGSIQLQFSRNYIASSAALLQADGATAGGSIVVNGGAAGRLYTSGSASADGLQGGTVELLGQAVILAAGGVDVSGTDGAGTAIIGGTRTGLSGVSPAQTVTITPSAVVHADALETGNGGQVRVWSTQKTDFAGTATATGGALSGAGGIVELSSAGTLNDGGQADAGAAHGAAGRLLLDPRNLVISGTTDVFPQFDFINPGNGTAFGSSMLALPNGNIVVADPSDSTTASGAGAVYLFNGQTGALISTLTGSQANDDIGDPLGGGGVILLSNGNYLVSSPNWNGTAGAVTWCNGSTGTSGVVGAANSLVGTNTGDYLGSTGVFGNRDVQTLSNGNYVVDSPNWNGTLGAVTWGNGSTGTSGPVSSINSLVGGKVGDQIGNNGVFLLSNGNYVVSSPNWILPTSAKSFSLNVGAVTWGSGSAGVSGIVSGSNSLVGVKAGDQIGINGVIPLRNGNYVVASPDWNSFMGAATWVNGLTGQTSDGTSIISALNSLVGSSSDLDDDIGVSVTALSNGNYVVGSPGWNAGRGAATWGNGNTGTSGTVSILNSVFGSLSGDGVGYSVIALTNGNYVVVSSHWDQGLGAVTWANGSAATTFEVDSANSLVGAAAGDNVGAGGVIALTNGNYVVASPNWSTNTGSVTWGNGSVGTSGTVSGDNSIIGATGGDKIGSDGAIALTNGNYVVDSPAWHGGRGAVTWGSGSEFVDEVVSAANSTVGSNTTDHVGTDLTGSALVTTLSNGNYVVVSTSWSNGSGEAGAVTWGNGSIGTSGIVSADNSLVGASNDAYVVPGIAVTALSNGNYVVENPGWNNGRGAVTWGNGSIGTSGAVSAENSLVGDYQFNSALNSDIVGVDGIWPLKNGDYVIASAFWNNNTGALTWVSGFTGQTGDGSNTINAQNSVLGANYGSALYFGVQETPNHTFAATFANDSPNGAVVVAPTDPSSVAFGFAAGHDLDLAPSALARALANGTDVTIQASNDITINDPITVSPGGAAGSLTLQAGRSILINASISTGNGNLTLSANDTLLDGVVDGDRQPGAAVLTMAPGTSIDAGTGQVSITLGGDAGDGKSNAASGAITLQAVHAAALQVVNNGLSPGSDIDLDGAIDTGAGAQSYQDANGLLMPNATGLGSVPLTGHVSFAGASTLAVNINGTVATSQYAQVQAMPNSTGAIDLANLALNVTFGYTPAVGDSWTIVRAGAITGKFVQGSYVFVDNRLLQIVYGPTSVDLVYITNPAVTITPLAGSGQAIVPETTFAPLQVLVVDSAGNPVPGETVTFNASAAFYGGTAITNAQGIATQTGVIAADKAGSYTISATVAGASSPAVFALASLPGPATQLVFANLPGYGQPIAGQSFGLDADVLDHWSNLATEDNSQVTLTLTGPGPLTNGSNFVTVQTVGGVAAFTGLTLSFAGSYTLTLADGSLTVPAPQALTVFVGKPAFLELSAPATSATVGNAFSSQPSAKVVDSSGNPVAGVPITFTVSGGPNGAGATFSGGGTTTAADTDSRGVASPAALTANTIAGSYTVTAAAVVAAPTADLQAAVPLTNVAGFAASITPTLGNGEAAAVATAFAPLQVTVTDAFGNPIPGASVTFTATAGAGGASATIAGSGTATTNAQGIATAPTVTAGHTAGSFTISASVPGASPAIFTLTDLPGASNKLAFVNVPAAVTAGQNFHFQVDVQDSFGNLVTSDFSQVTVTLSGPSTFADGSATESVQAIDGVASFSALAITTAGNYTLGTADGTLNAPPAAALSVDAAQAVALLASPAKSSTTVGTPFPGLLTVEAVDGFGNPVANLAVTFTAVTGASGAGGSFTGNTTITTGSNGVATAPGLMANDAAGNFTVTATAGSLSTSFSLTNTAAPGAIKVSAGNNQTATVNAQYATPLQVTVTDVHGNPVVGVPVTFTLPTTGVSGTFAGSATVLTGAGGIATAPALTADTVSGSFHVVASVAGLSGLARFTLTNVAGPVAGILTVAQDTEPVHIGTAFPINLKVQLVDQFDNPVLVSGIKVTFTIIFSGKVGGSFPKGATTVTVTTNKRGSATAPRLTANLHAGGFSVTASTAGVPESAIIDLDISAD
jgi:hypothetical protein